MLFGPGGEGDKLMLPNDYVCMQSKRYHYPFKNLILNVLKYSDSKPTWRSRWVCYTQPSGKSFVETVYRGTGTLKEKKKEEEKKKPTTWQGDGWTICLSASITGKLQPGGSTVESNGIKLVGRGAKTYFEVRKSTYFCYLAPFLFSFSEVVLSSWNHSNIYSEPFQEPPVMTAVTYKTHLRLPRRENHCCFLDNDIITHFLGAWQAVFFKQSWRWLVHERLQLFPLGFTQY